MGRAHLFSAASGNEVGKFVRHIDAAPALLISRMAKKAVLVGTRSTASQISSPKRKVRDDVEVIPTTRQKPSALLDTRVVYCGDNLEQPAKRPDAWTRTK